MGFLFASPTRAEQAAYDAALPQLIEAFLMSISGELNYQPLSGLDDIGEVTYGTTSVSRTGALSMRYDTIGFRRGDVVAILIIAYPDGDEPTVTISGLGTLVDERILEHLSNAE